MTLYNSNFECHLQRCIYKNVKVMMSLTTNVCVFRNRLSSEKKNLYFSAKQEYPISKYRDNDCFIHVPATVFALTSTVPQCINWTILRKSSGSYLFTLMSTFEIWRAFLDFLDIFISSCDCRCCFKISWYITLLIRWSNNLYYGNHFERIYVRNYELSFLK